MNDLPYWDFIRCGSILAYFRYDDTKESIVEWTIHKDMNFFEKEVQWNSIDSRTQIDIATRFIDRHISDNDIVPWGDDIGALVALERS